MTRKFAILLICTCLVATGVAVKSRPKVALQNIVANLETLSRITNGIALQKELNSKSLNLDNVLAEILGMNPKENALEGLRKLITEELSERYASFSKQTGSVKKSNIDKTKVESPLNTLQQLGQDLAAVKKGESQNVTEIMEKGQKGFQLEHSLFSKSFERFPMKFNDTMSMFGDYYDGTRFESSFSTLADEIPDFQTKVANLMNANKTLNDLWTMIGISSQLTSIESLGKVASLYNQSMADLVHLKTTMGTLKNEFASLKPFIEKRFSMTDLNSDLESLLLTFKKLSLKSDSTKELTSGLPRGVADFNKISKDVQDPWFANKLARKNHTAIKELAHDLVGIGALGQKLKKPESAWKSLKSKINLQKVETSRDFLNSAVATVLEKSKFQALLASTSQIGQCLANLSPMIVTVNFADLDDSLSKLKALEKAALAIKPLVTEFSKLAILQNRTIFGSLRTDLKNIKFDKLSPIGMQKKAGELREKEDYQNLLTASLEALSIMRRMQDTGIADVLGDQIKNLSALGSVKDVLSGTNLIGTLECLKSKKFDAVGIAQFLKFGSAIRSLGEDYKMDKSMETFLTLMNQFKTSLENLATPTRPKRSTSSVDSFKNGLTISQDLSKGVDTFKKMAELYGKRDELNQVLKMDQKVFNEIQKLLTSLDISRFQAELKKTSKDLESLESYAQKHQNPNLQTIGGIFEKASAIKGVSIDAKLLVDPVSTSFGKSSDPAIRNTVAPLETLGSVQLDFSSAQSDFKTASLAITKLQDFFDGLFPMLSDYDSAPAISVDQNTLMTYGIPAVGTLGTLVLLYFLIRYIRYEIKRRDLNSYLHLLDSGEESVLTVSKVKGGPQIETFPLHRSVQNGKYNEVKASVKRGANVNAYTREVGAIVTPLHLAVFSGEMDVVKLLLRNGADPTLRDLSYNLAQDYFEGEERKTMEALVAKYRGRKGLRRLPKLFPPSKYQLAGPFEFHDPFEKKFESKVVEDYQHATHIVMRDDKNRVVSYEVLKTWFPCFFGNYMIMSKEWKTKCLKWYNRRLLADHKYRIEGVEIKGKVFNTIQRIHRHFQEREIPFLTGVTVYINGFRKNDKFAGKLEEVVKSLGAHVGLNKVPKRTDAVFRQGPTHPTQPYYFDNKGHIFIICGWWKSIEVFKRVYPHVVGCNRFSLFDIDDFMQFLFTFEPHHYKLSGKKDETSFTMWQDVPEPGEGVARGAVEEVE